MLINTCVWAYLQIHEGLLWNKEKGKPKHTCLWGLTPNTAELKEKEHASDPRVQYVGRKSKKPPFWSNTKSQRFQWLCWRNSSHCSMLFQLPGGRQLPEQRVGQCRQQILLPCWLQKCSIAWLGLISGRQHSPPTTASACLRFQPWSGSQTPKRNICNSEVDSPRGWPLISEPSRSVWPEE